MTSRGSPASSSRSASVLMLSGAVTSVSTRDCGLVSIFVCSGWARSSEKNSSSPGFSITLPVVLSVAVFRPSTGDKLLGKPLPESLTARAVMLLVMASSAEPMDIFSHPDELVMTKDTFVAAFQSAEVWASGSSVNPTSSQPVEEVMSAFSSGLSSADVGESRLGSSMAEGEVDEPSSGTAGAESSSCGDTSVHLSASLDADGG